jgi:hypothetical protein
MGKEDHVFDVPVLENSRVKANIAGDLKIGRGLRKWLFDGGLFSDLGPFLTRFGQNDYFSDPIFPFFSFFRLSDTVYSRGRCDPVQLLIRKRL